MALADMLSRYQDEQQNLQDLLSRQQQDIDPSIERAKQLVEAKRGSFFQDKLNPLIGSISGNLGVNPVAGQPSGRLDRSLGRSLDLRRKTMASKGVSQAFQQAFDEAVQSGLNERNARDYAFKVAQQNQEQGLYSDLASQSRDAALERENIANLNAEKMSQIDEANQPQQFSTSDLIMAQLLGLGAATGTAYGLNKYMKNKTTPTTSSGYMSELTPYTAGASGRVPSYWSGNDYGYGESRVRSPFLNRFGGK